MSIPPDRDIEEARKINFAIGCAIITTAFFAITAIGLASLVVYLVWK